MFFRLFFVVLISSFESTGPEIFAQTNGKIDAFTCATGTGGTLAGVGMYLTQKVIRLF